MGNKGAVLLRFIIDDSSFCFVGCHFESGNGQTEIKRREESMASIYENGFINERGTYQAHYSVANHDFVTILGDVNYRI